jgi:hypothetical protein
MDLIPQIIFEEEIEFVDEERYEEFITYCNWYIFDGDDSDIAHIEYDRCRMYRSLCNLYVEPNYTARLMIETYKY